MPRTSMLSKRQNCACWQKHHLLQLCRVKQAIDTRHSKRCCRFGSGSTILLYFPVVIYSSTLFNVIILQFTARSRSHISINRFKTCAFVFNPLHWSPRHFSQNLRASFPCSAGFLYQTKHQRYHPRSRKPKATKPFSYTLTKKIATKRYVISRQVNVSCAVKLLAVNLIYRQKRRVK